MLYKETSTYRNNVKMICALAFVDNSNMEKAFECLVDFFLNTKVDQSILHLLFWVEENFLKNTTFKYKYGEEQRYIFSVYYNVINDFPRTQNSIEGWHRSLNARTNNKNQSLFNLFKELQNQQNSTDIKITQSLYINVCPITEVNDLKEICLNYEKYYGVDYLLKIASLLSLKFE